MLCSMFVINGHKDAMLRTGEDHWKYVFRKVTIRNYKNIRMYCNFLRKKKNSFVKFRLFLSLILPKKTSIKFIVMLGLDCLLGSFIRVSMMSYKGKVAVILSHKLMSYLPFVISWFYLIEL